MKIAIGAICMTIGLLLGHWLPWSREDTEVMSPDSRGLVELVEHSEPSIRITTQRLVHQAGMRQCTHDGGISITGQNGQCFALRCGFVESPLSPGDVQRMQRLLSACPEIAIATGRGSEAKASAAAKGSEP